MTSSALAQNCLADGAPCTYDGGMGICCTKFCLQQPNEGTGFCTTR